MGALLWNVALIQIMFVFRNWQGVYLGPSRLRSAREEARRLETRKAGFIPPLLETTEQHTFVSALPDRSRGGKQ